MLKNTEILKDRFHATIKGIESRIAGAKASSRATAKEEVEELQTRLHAMRDAAKDGWERMTEQAAAKLNGMLDSLHSDDSPPQSKSN